MLSKVTLTNSGDSWYLDVGRITRDQRAELVKWCHECWGNSWGEVDTQMDHTVFIFPRLAHANWFVLKWAD